MGKEQPNKIMGVSGQLFQIKLIVLVLLRALKRTDEFKLAANIEIGGVFDDLLISLKYMKGNKTQMKNYFVCTKHKDDIKKTVINCHKFTQEGDFSIVKFFDSYNTIIECIQRRKLRLFERANDNEFIVYTNTAIHENEAHLKIKIQDDVIVASNGYELKFNDENEYALFELLAVSSPGKRLAKILAESIFKYDRALDIRTGLLRKYQKALISLIRPNRDKRFGKFDANFISGENLSAIEREFRAHFYREIAHITNVKDHVEQAKLLTNKNVKLPNKFGQCGDDSDDKLPDDYAMRDRVKIREFLDKFRILVEQTDESNLDSIILEEIQVTYCLDVDSSKIVYREVKENVENWWKYARDAVKYLTHDTDFFNDAIEKLTNVTDYKRTISSYAVRFNSHKIAECETLLKNNRERVVDVECNQTLLHVILLHQSLKNLPEYRYENNYIIIQLATLIKIQTAILNAFRNQIKLLIVVVEGDGDGMKILHEIRSIATKVHNKKFIIVNKSDLNQQDVNFSDFDQATQDALKQKLLDFQGVSLPLSELNIAGLLDESDIVALICDERLKIGNIPSQYCTYFIRRCLSNNIIIKSFQDMKGRIIGVCGDQGCGKTQLLEYLIQQAYSKKKIVWLSKINLTSYDVLPTSVDVDKAVDFLAKKLQLNSLSKKVFKQRIESEGNVILIFEITENVGFSYKTNFNNLLQVLKSTQIDKIVVSFLTSENIELDCNYNLRPFNFQEQCTLIEKLWKTSFDTQAVKNFIKSSLEYFASNKPQLNATLGNPRNIKTFAEIYQRVIEQIQSKRAKDYHFSVYAGLNNFYEFSIGDERLKSSKSKVIECELLQFIRCNNHKEIEKLIRCDQYLINSIYDQPFNKRLLAITCQDFAKEVSADTVKLLLDLGADLHQREELHQNRCILHFAILGQNKQLLEFIIESISNPQLLNESSLLHLIIMEGNPLDDDFLPCIQTLLRYKINVKQYDRMNMTPLQNAANKGYTEVVRKILDHYLFEQIACFKSECEAIKQIGINIENWNIRVCDDDQNYLLNYLASGNEKEFVDCIEERIKMYNYLVEEPRFMQIACEKNMLSAVDVLLNCGNYYEDHFKDSDRPIMITAKKGYYKIFERLINHEGTRISDELLPLLLKNLEKETLYNDDINYAKCFQLFLESNRKSINPNFKDVDGNYLLYYAVKYGGSKVALELLKCNASLANKNDANGKLTIEDIDIETLREHFDSCIYMQEDLNNRNEASIIFNYSTLYPNEDDLKQNASYSKISQSVVDIDDGSDPKSESKVLYHISQHSELQPLLEHPIINSFLDLKWNRIKWIFYTNLIFYLIFCVNLIVYSLFYYYLQEDFNRSVHYITKVLLCLLLLTLILRELFQVYISRTKYLCNFENYLECFLIIIVIGMILTEKSSVTIKKQLCSVGLLLAAFELLFLIGNFDLCSIYVAMFRRVSLNFFKCFVVYIVLIVAFAVSFLTLFEHNPSVESDDEQDYFTNIFYSFLKTIIMLTGEFEAGGIILKHYPYASYFVFILFVLSITIILFNLLNGLAVSDTAEIRKIAQLIGLQTRVEYVSYAESISIKFNKMDSVTLYPKHLVGYTYVVNSNANHFNPNIIKKAMHIIHERNRKLKHEFDVKEKLRLKAANQRVIELDRKQKDLEISAIQKKLEEHDKLLNEILIYLKSNK